MGVSSVTDVTFRLELSKVEDEKEAALCLSHVYYRTVKPLEHRGMRAKQRQLGVAGA